jgi:hypothetical protein
VTDWSLLEAARSYAARGWAVFPVHSIQKGRCTCGKSNCESAGKHPRTQNGFKDATTDEDQITAWWLDWPTANVAVATGERSKLGVVDVDPRNGGYESLKTLDVPATMTEQTGGGGLHYFYQTSQRVATHDIAPGIELHADVGYVVVTPSNHLKGDYAWITMQDVLTPLPTWAMNGVVKRSDGPIVVSPDQKTWVADRLTTPCPQGGRHKALTQLAGYFRNISTEPVTLAILTTWNSTYCLPPLADREIEKQVHDVYHRYQGSGDQPSDLWTSASLLSAEFPPLAWIVDGLLPEGLVILAGRPKRGKSWLALQIACDVVNDKHSLGTTTAGRVLYIALEDSPRRLQSRLRAMRVAPSDDLLFLTEFPDIDGDGQQRLEELIDVYRPILVVVDTLSRVIGKKHDQDSSADMTGVLAPLQTLAGQRHCCILLVDHHRKPGAEVVDMIDDIAGSTAKTAVADAIIGLYRKSGESLAQLKITGRDVEERDLLLTWDPLKFHWKLEPTTALNPTEKQILNLVGELKKGTIVQVAAAMGRSVRTIQESMSGLVDKGLLTRESIESGKKGASSFMYRVAGQ